MIFRLWAIFFFFRYGPPLSIREFNFNLRILVADKSESESESELRTVNYLSNREYGSRASATDLLSRVIRSDIHDLRPLGRVVVRSSDG